MRLCFDTGSADLRDCNRISDILFAVSELFQWSGNSTKTFVGFDNYKKMFTTDTVAMTAMKNNAVLGNSIGDRRNRSSDGSGTADQ